jgi:hypothetical protein
MDENPIAFIGVTFQGTLEQAHRTAPTHEVPEAQ